MKKILTIAILLSLWSCSTNNSNNSQSKESIKEDNLTETFDVTDNEGDIVISGMNEYLKEYYKIDKIKIFYEYMFGDKETPLPDLTVPKDLSGFSYEELRLLRNQIFARNGYLFGDPYLRGYFNQFDWYRPIFKVEKFKVQLSEKEQKAVNRILAEEKKRKENNQFVEKNGLKLFNSDLIVNSMHYGIKEYDKEYNLKNIAKLNDNQQLIKDLKENNFSIRESDEFFLFRVYEQNCYNNIPSYVTTDSYSYLLNKYFSENLCRLEENFLHPTLIEILKSTLNKVENTWAKDYLSIALYALGEKVSLKNELLQEKNSIDNLSGNPSFIPNIYVNYQDLTPRGNYERSQELKNYFRGFKWLSINGIDLDNQEQITGFLQIARTIANDKNILAKYKSFVDKMIKFAGPEDNRSITDIINYFEKNSNASDQELISYLTKLDKERIKIIYSKANDSKEKETIRVDFISPTYSINAEIFTKLVCLDPQGNPQRPFPTSLDLLASFNDKTSQNILLNEYNEAKKWKEYPNKLKECQNQFKNFKDWDECYSAKSLNTLLGGIAENSNYPDFMKTDAYNRKEINMALANWTILKHDLVLYEEKPFGAECGDGGDEIEAPEPPNYYGYVEPNVEYYKRAISLCDWLNNFFNSSNDYTINSLKEMAQTMLTISEKELKNQALSQEENEFIKYIGGQMESLYLNIIDKETYTEDNNKMALVTDVYACRDLTGGVKQLLEAIGYADQIYVVVPIKGEYHIAKGAVFSYYESIEDNVMTDKQWQERLDNNNAFARPKFMQNLIRDYQDLDGIFTYRCW